MWFDGSVQEAVSKSLKESKLFVVLIHGKQRSILCLVCVCVCNTLSLKTNNSFLFPLTGDDEVSTKTKSSLESVASKVTEHSVAICLAHDSENAKHFSEIYPYKSVPSVFIIKSGVAKIVESGDVDGQSFVSKLLSLVVSAPQEATAPAAASSSTPVQTQSTPSSTSPQLSLEEKVNLAKQRLAEANKKKEKLAEEQEKLREKERREAGRELMKATRTREEMEIQEAIAERKRDAQLEKEARARVLAQIAADNEERKRKFGAITPSPNNKASTGASPSKQFNFNSDDTRIQFKFPDGHTVAQVFPSSEKLEAALRFIQEQEASFRSFSLSTAYPRRVFTESDFSSSFSDLGLVPSSVLLIIPKSGHSNSQYPSVSDAVTSFSISSLFTSLILSPLWSIWTFVSSIIWGAQKVPDATDDSSPSGASSSTPNRNRKTSPGSRRRSGSGGSTVIHRLKRDSSNDDDNNTWNGNSTQQK